jgi:MFS family permease
MITIKKNFFKKFILPFIVVTTGSTFYLYEFFLRVLPGVLSYDIMHDMKITAYTFGIIGTCFYYGYISMQIPIGILCDRYGPKKLLTASIAACSVATIVFGYSYKPFLSGLSRLVVGVASAAAFIGPLSLTTKWYDKKYFALITGLIQVLGCVGAVFGGEPLAALTQHIQWRQAVIWAGMIGIILTFFYIIIIQDSPTKEIKQKETTSLKNELNRLKKVTNKRQNWYTGIAAMCCWAPIAIFSELWGIPFLMDLQHIDNAAAASEAAWVWYGVAIGSPIVGWLSDKIMSRCIPIIICGAIGLVSSTALIYFHVESTLTIEILLFCFGLAASSQVVTFGLVADNNSEDTIGTAIGFNNMAVISGAVLQTLVGIIISSSWQGNLMNGSPIYTIVEFRYAFAIIPLISLLSIFTGYFLIKETKCQKTFN